MAEELRYPAVTPMLAYEDVARALEWLASSFGFRERLRYTEPDGRITHAEMELGDALIMLANPTSAYQSPKRHRESCDAARAWSAVPHVIDGVLVYVDELDAHFRRAKRGGARILSEPKEQPYGDRHYTVEDLEGHRWMFAQHVRDVTPEEWGATRTAQAGNGGRQSAP